MRHSCWGFIESACMKTSLPDAGNTLYGPRASRAAPRRPAPGAGSRVATAEDGGAPPAPPIRRTSGESFMFYVKYRNGRLTYARLKTEDSVLDTFRTCLRPRRNVRRYSTCVSS